MATLKGGSTKEKTGKKPHKNKLTSKKYSQYIISDDKIQRKLKHCPRCGPGVFLADHKTRLYCGKCHYTEFADKKQDSIKG